MKKQANEESEDDKLDAIAVAALKTGDYAVSARIWRAQADAGLPRARSWLGYMAEHGLGVPVDKEKAAMHFDQAARDGYPLAAYRLAALCYHGDGVARSHPAAAWWWRHAAESGHADSQFHIGEMLFYGVGIQRSYEEGVRWLKAAAMQNHVGAALALAEHYYDGYPDTYELAVPFAEIAAAQGNENAQFILATMHENGHGVEQSNALAMFWYRKAAAQGHEDAAKCLVKIRRSMEGATVFDFIDELLKDGTPLAGAQLVNDEASVFWVSPSAYEEKIFEDCEAVLHTGSLKTTWISEDPDDPKYGLLVEYKGALHEVLLPHAPSERHLAVVALSKLLMPDYEIRLCLNVPEPHAFLPLPPADWARLEAKYGRALSRHFYVLSEKPNVFANDFKP